MTILVRKFDSHNEHIESKLILLNNPKWFHPICGVLIAMKDISTVPIRRNRCKTVCLKYGCRKENRERKPLEIL